MLRPQFGVRMLPCYCRVHVCGLGLSTICSKACLLFYSAILKNLAYSAFSSCLLFSGFCLLCSYYVKLHTAVPQKGHCTCRKSVITGDASSISVLDELRLLKLKLWELHSAIRTCLPCGSCTYICSIPSCHSYFSGVMPAARVSLLCRRLCRHIVHRPNVVVFLVQEAIPGHYVVRFRAWMTIL